MNKYMENNTATIMNNKITMDEKTFIMPDCRFEYPTCGSCRYYGTEGWNGFCEYHRRRISSSDRACGYYE